MRSLTTTIALTIFLGASPLSHASVVLLPDGKFVQAICNPGFEDGTLEPWFEDAVFTPSETWDLSTDLPLVGSTASAMVNGNNELRQDFTEFAERVANTDEMLEIVEFKFQVRHPDQTATNTFVTIFYDDGSEQSQNYRTDSTEWEEIDLRPDIVPGLTPVGISVFGNNSGRTFIDNFSMIAMVPIPEPGSSALLLLGAAGLLLRRQRSV